MSTATSLTSAQFKDVKLVLGKNKMFNIIGVTGMRENYEKRRDLGILSKKIQKYRMGMKKKIKKKTRPG